MSSENEGQQPDGEFGPTSQFDAFRARQADDRAQQETQGAYAFPPEYAADPATVFPPEQPGPPLAGPPPGNRFGGGRFGSGFNGGGFGAAGGRRRSVAIFAGAVVVTACVAFGAIEAFGSSSPSATAGSPSTPAATSSATGAGAGADKHARAAVTIRVIVESVGTDSFTGKLTSTGQSVTVLLTDKTHYGTSAHPFSEDELASGEIVIVRGKRTAADTLTATIVDGGQPSGSAAASGDDA